MVSWEWLIVTFMVSGLLGILITTLCSIAKDNKKEN